MTTLQLATSKKLKMILRNKYFCGFDNNFSVRLYRSKKNLSTRKKRSSLNYQQKKRQKKTRSKKPIKNIYLRSKK